MQWRGGGVTFDSDRFCGNAYGVAKLTADLGWKPWPTLRIGLQNHFTALMARDVEPANTVTAEVRCYPAVNCKLFSTLRIQSMYQNMSVPQVNNTITAQLGPNF